ncbi:hypothetical protein Zmor_020126 [Zophobas morio]|uniref:Uncharacterized protein n=1 Tax=Zophobas morio TaxID=2755281 RepID=A0AA38I764_9CUCU|nr:hypothetical protein Zmor_020126 [Zophobas morio]
MKGGVVARAEFGAPGCGCSPTHDGNSILSQALPHRTPLSRRHVPRRAGRYGRKLVIGSRLLGQLDKEPRTPLPPRIIVLFTSIPFKCSISITLISTRIEQVLKFQKEQ